MNHKVIKVTSKHPAGGEEIITFTRLQRYNDRSDFMRPVRIERAYKPTRKSAWRINRLIDLLQWPIHWEMDRATATRPENRGTS